MALSPHACLLVASAGALVAWASGCTLLATFNDRGDAACSGGACDGGTRPDVATAKEAGSGGGRDAHSTVVDLPDATLGDGAVGDGALGDGEPGDAVSSADVGDCAAMPDGSACAKPTACTMASTCMSGVCTPNPLPDMTMCGAAPDACHAAPVCMSGVCQPAAALADATPCGTSSSMCAMTPVCMSGTCTPVPANDGTVCGTAPDACHTAPVCGGGTCGAPPNAAKGTQCGAAPDACHDVRKCSAGTCEAAVALAEGTNWNAGDSNARCCGGKAVETTTTANCGVCGWACGAGQACGMIAGEYVCTGCVGDGDCASNCCSTNPAPNHCSPSNCNAMCQTPDICTGGSHCVMGATIDYCAY